MSQLSPSFPRAVSRARPNAALLGWAALTVTVLIWAAFALTIRAIGHSPLTPGDVSLIRFLMPAALLLPLLPSRLPALRRVPPHAALMIAAGAGLPFFLITAAGGASTSAAHVSALVAGTTPLSVVLVGALLFRDRVTAAQWPGLGLILLGVVLLVVGLGTVGTSPLTGIALLLSASLLWGGYTLGMRRAGLDPLAVAMLVTYPSLLMLAPLLLTGTLPSHLTQVPAQNLLPFIAVQGLGVGVVASLTYPYALKHLGTLRCATVGALAPVLATLLALLLLGERPSVASAIGVAIVTTGVLVFNLMPTRTKGAAHVQ
ncbi:DMT family transporter [Deinococcus sp. RM]|uniref:DMT family transporter n=1 Tax=Deinococcus sp. RM TaxID=2316359 RepID=UPI0018F554FB|nr:DMT family transporter [Deinococcus sp. RM]